MPLKVLPKYRLSLAQREALRSVGRCGSVRVKWANTNIRTSGNLKARGFIRFDDALGKYVLTEDGLACLLNNGYTKDGMAAWPSPSMPVSSADSGEN